jgi:hypothetical protein
LDQSNKKDSLFSSIRNKSKRELFIFKRQALTTSPAYLNDEMTFIEDRKRKIQSQDKRENKNKKCSI